MAITRLRQALSDAKDADDDRGHIVASIVPCMVLAFIALMMRLVSRRITRSRFFVSDYLAIAGLLCAWVVSLIAVVGRLNLCGVLATLTRRPHPY